MNQRFALLCICCIAAVSLFGSVKALVPPTITPYTADPYHNAVNIPLPANESTGGYSYMVETEKGIFWTGTTNKIYRSTDLGLTWTVVKDIGVGAGASSFDHFGDTLLISGGNRLTSIDGGTTWQLQEPWQGGAGALWIYHSLIQLPNGTLVKPSWGEHVLYSSNDGVHWSLWFNMSAYMVNAGRQHDPLGHGGGLDYNPYQNRIYYSTDCTYGYHERDVWYADYNSKLITTWKLLEDNATGLAGYSAANRMIHTPSREILSTDDGDDNDIKAVDNGMSTYYKLPADRFMGWVMPHYAGGEYSLVYKNGVTYLGGRAIGTEGSGWSDELHPYGFWASADDGMTWTPIYRRWAYNKVAAGQSLWWLYEGDYHLFIGNPEDNKLYMMPYLTVDEVRYLQHKDEATIVGKSFTWETVVANGLNTYLPLGTASLSRCNVTLIGESSRNYLNNSGWEDGTTGWLGVSPERNESTKWEGAYGGQYRFDGPNSLLWTWQQPISTTAYDVWSASIYVKKEYSSLAASFFLQLIFTNETYSATIGRVPYVNAFNLTTSWARISVTSPSPAWATEVQLRMGVDKLDNGQLAFMDAAMLEKLTPWTQEAQRYDINHPSPYVRYSSNSTNPSVTIGGTEKSYTGALSLGESSPTSVLTLPVTSGAVPITNVHVSGSGKVRIRVTGTLNWHISGSLILSSVSGEAVFGRRWNDTFDIPAAIQNPIVLLNWQSSLIASNYEQGNLSFTVAAASSADIVTKVYCGSNAKPKVVSGALSSSYDPSTKILDVPLNHSGQATINVSWDTLSENQNSDSTTPATKASKTPELPSTIKPRNLPPELLVAPPSAVPPSEPALNQRPEFPSSSALSAYVLVWLIGALSAATIWLHFKRRKSQISLVSFF